MKAEEHLSIVGISHVAFQVKDLEQSCDHYTTHHGFEVAFFVSEERKTCYLKINDDQFLKLVEKPEGTDDNRLVEVAFQVSDINSSVAFLRAKGLNPSPVKQSADGTMVAELVDPDGHRLVFAEQVAGSKQVLSRGKHLGAKRISDRLMHVGLTIEDEVAANAFYREALGFQEIWRGSRVDGGPDAWVNMQMPGERGDYIEYILINDMQPSRKQLGSMLHVCFLADDIHETHRNMLQNSLPDLERYQPMIGRNNRWLFNVHDIDGTRSEMMEPREARSK